MPFEEAEKSVCKYRVSLGVFTHKNGILSRWPQVELSALINTRVSVRVSSDNTRGKNKRQNL